MIMKKLQKVQKIAPFYLHPLMVLLAGNSCERGYISAEMSLFKRLKCLKVR